MKLFVALGLVVVVLVSFGVREYRPVALELYVEQCLVEIPPFKYKGVLYQQIVVWEWLDVVFSHLLEEKSVEPMLGRIVELDVYAGSFYRVS